MCQMKMILCKTIKKKIDPSQVLSLSSFWQHMNTDPFKSFY